MEKKLTINDIFFFVNQAIEKEIDMFCWSIPNKTIENKDFGISLIEETSEIEIRGKHNFLNNISFKISDLEAAQFKVLYEKVKEYSKNKMVDKFLNYFKEEDDSEKTIDDIDD